MEIKLERYIGRRHGLDNRISITRIGNLGISALFYEEKNVRDFKWAVLYYDSENKIIGIRFTNNQSDPGKLKIVHYKEGKGAAINGKSFFGNYNINTQECNGRYAWKKEIISDIGEIYLIKLDDKEGGF